MKVPLKTGIMSSSMKAVWPVLFILSLGAVVYSQETLKKESEPAPLPAATPATPIAPASDNAPQTDNDDVPQTDGAPQTRGMTPLAGTGQAGFKYNRRRAVIVGINYVQAGKDVGKTKSGLVGQLKNAENDAREFHALLKDLYGYQDEDSRLLIGSDATRSNIQIQFESLLNNTEEDDSVLFYFSGHGIPYEHLQNHSSKVELVPFDYVYNDGASRPENCIPIDDLVRQIQAKCKARHKLLILDCCYAGSVFSLEIPQSGMPLTEPSPLSLGGRPITKADGIRSDDSIFKVHGFQAMTSSSLQPADDSVPRGPMGEIHHSPFTDALLKSLIYLPQQKGAGAILTTSQVFSCMQKYLDTNLRANQTPRCSWLDAGQGEFHFFLEGEPPDGKQSDEDIRKNLIAMVPGSFGNWWFDECPWFLPGLRYRILEQHTDVSRSLLLDIRTPTRLKLAAERLLPTLKEGVQADSRLARQLEDMELMMQGSIEKWEESARAIMDRLDNEFRSQQPLQKTTPMKAVDLHFLAVLRHALRENLPQTRQCYDAAIAAYVRESQENQQSRAMLAMCQADYGWFELDVAYDFDAASQHFAEALSAYGAMTPQPFTAYVLCRDAEAQLRLGREAVAENRLKKALTVIREVDPNEKEPLSAAYYHRCAWVQMAAFKFNDAEKSFRESSNIIGKSSLSGDNFTEQDIEATLMDLKNLHGIALTRRFQGNRDEAILLYRDLYNKIVKQFRDRKDNDSRDSNYRQTKTRLAEQIVNALEQMGDCSLFCYPTDAAEAADDYRRAFRTCGFLPLERRKRFEERIQYKLALAFALPGSPVHDPEMARLQLLQIRTSNKEQGVKAGADIKEKSIHLCSSLTNLLLAIDAYKSLQTDEMAQRGRQRQIHELLKDLRQDFRTYLNEERLNRSLSREDMEVSMFCLRTMLKDMKDDLTQIDQQFHEGYASHEMAETTETPAGQMGQADSEAEQGALSARLQRYNDLDSLLGFCRASRRGAKPVITGESSEIGSEPGTFVLKGGESLAFSRPYYDCAIQTLIDLKPANAKQLIEIAHEALTGDTHRKSTKKEVTLTIYCCSPNSYVLLDIPQSTSQYFSLPGHINAESIQDVLNEVNADRSRLDLPAEVYKELAIAALQELPVTVCWRDPVQKIGTTGIQQQHMAAHPVTMANGEPALIPISAETVSGARSSEGLFPFRIPSGLQLYSVVPKEIRKQAPNTVTVAK